jgi:hypothetical protein
MSQSFSALQGRRVLTLAWFKRLRARAATYTLALFLLTLTLLVAAQANADQKKVAIYGDSLATGLFFGMQELLGDIDKLDVVRRSQGGTGLVRDDEYDWVVQAEKYVSDDRPDVVVVSLGGNDRQDFTFNGMNVERFTEEWWIEYMRRAEQVMMSLKRGSRTVYWLGIPIVRSDRMTQDYAKLNVLFRELCRVHGIIHVDIWDKFRSADRSFSPYEKISGKIKRVRTRDGIHFTKFGNQRLAQIVTGAMVQQVAVRQ